VDFRKVQKTSDGTFFVTLPKTWVTVHHLERGSLISFDAAKDGKLSLGLYRENDRPPASIVLSPAPTLEREIEEKYLLGYDIITIESKAILQPDLRDSAKTMLRKLVGLEIVEEDAHRLVIQCLIEPSLLAPEKIIRRLHSITRAMQHDAIEAFQICDQKLAANVVERDEEVDRLYFLLVRILRTALTDLSTSERIHVSPVDCLDYRLLASFIEQFGDYAASIARNSPTNSRRIPGSLSKGVQKCGSIVNTMYSLAIEAVLSRNLAVAAEATKLGQQALIEMGTLERTFEQLRSDILGKATSAISSLKAMRGVSVDIADLAMTR